MADFRSLQDLARYFGANSGAIMASQPELMNILRKEIYKLEQLMKEELQKYFESYQPVQYERTGATMDSFRVGEPYIEGNSICAEITFDDVLANHPSVIGEDQEFGYTPWLLSVGWDIRSKVLADIPMFTHHPGSQYITTAVSRYNRQNKYGIIVSVYYGDEQYI